MRCIQRIRVGLAQVQRGRGGGGLLYYGAATERSQGTVKAVEGRLLAVRNAVGVGVWVW